MGTPEPNYSNAQQVLTNFRERYDYITLAWYPVSTYDDVYITVECLKPTGDDRDADGFRDCLFGITWNGATGESYGFDDLGEVTGLAPAVVEVLPTGERNEDNQGEKVVGHGTIE